MRANVTKSGARINYGSVAEVHDLYVTANYDVPFFLQEAANVAEQVVRLDSHVWCLVDAFSARCTIRSFVDFRWMGHRASLGNVRLMRGLLSSRGSRQAGTRW